jgi:hypothetical protein
MSMGVHAKIKRLKRCGGKADEVFLWGHLPDNRSRRGFRFSGEDGGLRVPWPRRPP